MINVGKMNNMEVVKELEFGMYLDSQKYGEILLPKRYIPENCEVGDFIDVFIYLDSEDKLIATTETPLAMVDEFAFLKVIAVNRVGAFMDWGLMKDLYVPFKEQIEEMVEGKSYMVYVYYDYESERICASSKLTRFVYTDIQGLNIGSEVDIFVVEETDLGFKAIVNGDYLGLLYHNEIFQDIKGGDKLKGFVKRVRPDGRIDLCLQKPGYEKVTSLSQQIVDLMTEKGGTLNLNSKSSPEEISRILEMSKKSFKMAIGKLYKARLIDITEDGIVLTKKK